MAYGQITVDAVDGATPIVGYVEEKIGAVGYRGPLTIFNNEPNGGNVCYYGDDDQITTGNCMPLPAQVGMTVNNARGGLWVVCGVGTVDLRWITEVVYDYAR